MELKFIHRKTIFTAMVFFLYSCSNSKAPELNAYHYYVILQDSKTHIDTIYATSDSAAIAEAYRIFRRQKNAAFEYYLTVDKHVPRTPYLPFNFALGDKNDSLVYKSEIE